MPVEQHPVICCLIFLLFWVYHMKWTEKRRLKPVNRRFSWS